jgi:hypothetical protein
MVLLRLDDSYRLRPCLFKLGPHRISISSRLFDYGFIGKNDSQNIKLSLRPAPRQANIHQNDEEIAVLEESAFSMQSEIVG